MMYAGKIQHEWSMTASMRMDMRSLKGVKTQWWHVNPLEERPTRNAFEAFREAMT